jgi:hypothetical protein
MAAVNGHDIRRRTNNHLSLMMSLFQMFERSRGHTATPAHPPRPWGEFLMIDPWMSHNFLGVCITDYWMRTEIQYCMAMRLLMEWNLISKDISKMISLFCAHCSVGVVWLNFRETVS